MVLKSYGSSSLSSPPSASSPTSSSTGAHHQWECGWALGDLALAGVEGRQLACARFFFDSWLVPVPFFTFFVPAFMTACVCLFFLCQVLACCKAFHPEEGGLDVEPSGDFARRRCLPQCR